MSLTRSMIITCLKDMENYPMNLREMVNSSVRHKIRMIQSVSRYNRGQKDVRINGVYVQARQCEKYWFGFFHGKTGYSFNTNYNTLTENILFLLCSEGICKGVTRNDIGKGITETILGKRSWDDKRTQP